MDKISHFIVHHRKAVLISFIVLTVISGILIPHVKVNYNMLDYLPAQAPSTVALEVMEEEFSQSIPNARVMIEDVTMVEALQYKEKLKGASGVQEVLWLDDQTDIKKPLDFIDQNLLEAYYKDGSALFQLTASNEDTVTTVKEIHEIIGEKGALSGQIVDLAKVQQSTVSEIVKIMAIMLPVGLLLLMVLTRNWLEPILLLVTIGVAIVLNLGSNLIFGEISFITQSVTSVLQLAVSLDYAIFLLHRYNDYRHEGLQAEDAMKLAIKKSAVAISSSAMTTFLGFLALVFMQFRIGADLGVVLAKGIIFSLVSVVGLLPVLVLILNNIVEKARHRSFLPNFGRLAIFLSKYHAWFLLIIVITGIGFLAQSKNDFMYGNDAYDTTSKESIDRVKINEVYGRESQIVILIPKGHPVEEETLVQELKESPNIKAVVSFSESVGNAIPVDILDENQKSQLISDNYNRIILFNNLPAEGKVSFDFMENLNKKVKGMFPEAKIAGALPAIYDMKEVTQRDNLIVNGLAVATIGVVILVAFRSISIPLLLLLTIETSIWLNLSIPYFQGTTLSYIGYLIISSVQLGATVDYGILFTQHYLDNREKYPKKIALRNTVREVVAPLLPPAMILSLAGFILFKISTLQVVSELGEVLGRGAFLSFIMVLFFLPALYMLFDGLIEKTSKGVTFVKEDNQVQVEEEQ